MSKQLEGKIAVITGGTSGIGLATARLFLDHGARVIVTGRSQANADAARETLGDRAEVIQSDAGDPAAVAALFADIGKRHDRIDILFLNAGFVKFAPIGELPDQVVDELLQVNFVGPYLALTHALPLLGDGSSVVVNTSVVDRKGLPGAAVYSASKAALRSLVRTAAAELSSRGIRVNAVSPGPVSTDIFVKAGLSQAEIEGFAAGIVGQVPLGRFGKPEELAQAALFLASDASAYIQGAELEVDGGMAQV